MAPAESPEQCVWIVPGDERRLQVMNLARFFSRGERDVRDMCTCCGEVVDCTDPHLCTDCCRGRSDT